MIIFQTIGVLLGLAVSICLIWLGAEKSISYFSLGSSYQSDKPDYKSLVLGIVIWLVGVMLTPIALNAVPNNLYSRLVILAVGIIMAIVGYYQMQTNECRKDKQSWIWLFITIYAIFNSVYLIAMELTEIVTFVKSLFLS